MCKLFAITNMSKVNFTSELIEVVRDEVCKLNDKDGFGYVVLGSNNKQGGERTVTPFNFKPLTPGNVFGKLDTNTPKVFLGHGRYSTNDVNLENTHPFTENGISLIHNGVVYDSGPEPVELKTTCDTEILLKYWQLGGMEAIEKNVSGYYAFALLDQQGVLHVARDSRASLFMSYSKTIDSMIIATTPQIIEGVAIKMGWEAELPMEIASNRYFTIENNKITSLRTIEPKAEKFWFDEEILKRSLDNYSKYATEDFIEE